MKYLIRLNPKAYNPISGKVIASRVWEVEQCATKDSGKMIWHYADVRIGEKHIREFFTLPKEGSPPTELTYFGICTRGQDNAIVIHEGRTEVG